ARRQRADVLSMEEALRGTDALRDAQDAAARGRERPAQTHRCRSESRQRDAPGGDPKKAVTPARRREMIDHLRVCYRVSIRGACRALGANRSTYQYRPKRTDQTALKKRIREIAETRVRYGYKRIWVLLRREGWRINHKRVHRLYREEGL